MSMSYGKMNRFAKIIERTVGKDGEGFKTEQETVIAQLRCYHERRQPTRRWANLAAFSEATDRFVMRAASALLVKPGYLIECDGARYQILSAENVRDRDMYLEIYAQKVVGILG